MEAESVSKVDQLFRSLPIGQIKEINHSLEIQANEKTNQLRSLVGSKYRSLLATADNIILMNTLVQEQDRKLAYFCDLKDTQAENIDKSINNYHSFLNIIIQNASKKQDHQALLRILLLTLQASLEELSSRISAHLHDDGLNINAVVDNQLIQISKEFHVLERLLKTLRISDSGNTLFRKFERLKHQYENTLKSLILSSNSYTVNYLSHDSLVVVLVSIMFLLDFDLVKLLNHYISLKSNLLNKVISSPRLIQLQNPQNLKKTLESIFISINNTKAFFPERYSSFSKTLLSQILKYPNFTNHQFKTNLRAKYSLLLEKFENLQEILSDCSFKYTINDYKSQFKDTEELYRLVESWKVELGTRLLINFQNRLDKIVERELRKSPKTFVSFTRLLGLINLVIREFKAMHTSYLTVLKTRDGEDILKGLINAWNENILKLLKSQLDQMSLVSQSIQNFSESLSAHEDASGLWSVSENDTHVKDINKYLAKISSLATTNLDVSGPGLKKSASAFSLVLVPLINFFNSFKVILGAFAESFEAFTTTGSKSLFNNSTLFDPDFNDQLSDDFRNDNDFDVYQNSDLIEAFTKTYSKYFLEIYHEVRSNFFNILLFDMLESFLSKVLNLKIGGTKSENYIYNLSILRLLLIFKKSIENPAFKESLLNIDANTDKGTLLAKSIEDNLHKLQKHANLLMVHYLNLLASQPVDELYENVVTAIIKRFVPLEASLAKIPKLTESDAEELKSITEDITFEKLEKAYDLKASSARKSDKNLLTNDLILEHISGESKQQLPEELDIWENDLPVLPSTEFSLLMFNLSKTLVSGFGDRKQSNLDLFKTRTFEVLKTNIIYGVLANIKESLVIVKELYQQAEKSKTKDKELQNGEINDTSANLASHLENSHPTVQQNALLSLADVYYVLSFLQSEATKRSLQEPIISEIESLLKELGTKRGENTGELLSSIDKKFIKKSMEDNFRQSRLLYLPLSAGDYK